MKLHLNARKLPIEILIGFLALVALLFGFAQLAEAVREPGGVPIDTRILLAFRDGQDLSNPLGPSWVAAMVRDLTSLGSWVVTGLLTLVVAGYFMIHRRPRSALFLIVAVAGGVLVGTLLKDLFARPRPDVVPHLVEVLSASFPSGHTVVSAIVYPTLGAMLARVIQSFPARIYVVSVGVLLALVVGTTRVYLGVHYPTDVLAGWTMGFAWALGCWLTIRALQVHRQVEPEPKPMPEPEPESVAAARPAGASS